MIVLILGIALWWGAHLFKRAAPAQRAALAESMGEGAKAIPAVAGKAAQPVGDLVQAPERLDDLQKNRVLLFQVILQLLEMFFQL